MLVKVGTHRINLAHVACVTENPDDAPTVQVGFVSGDSLELQGGYAVDFLNAWDKWAEFQADAQTMQEFAVAESLEQIKQAQAQKSGIVIPKATIPHRGR